MARSTKADKGRGSVPGLSIRTSSRGQVSYWFRFSLGGKLHTWTLPASSLKEARTQANAARAAVQRGEDPRPKAPRATLTLGRAAVLWLRSRDTQHWRPRTRKEMRGLLARHVLPGLRTKEVGSITRGDIWKKVCDLADKHVVTANRAFTTWRMLFGWLTAPDQEHLGVVSDPTHGLKKKKAWQEAPRSTTYRDDELNLLLLQQGDLGDWLRFILATGCRQGEALAARWEHIDMGRSTWTIPPELAKNAEGRTIPLNAVALAVLRARESTRFADGRVFSFTRPNKALAALSKALGFAVRPHDLRRTVGDRIKGEYGAAMMHGALGHSELRITATYGPTPTLRAQAAVLDWWAQQLEGVVTARTCTGQG